MVLFICTYFVGERVEGGRWLGLGGRCESTKVHQCHPVPVPQWRDFFQNQELFLMMKADSSLLGQSASGLNFYDDSGRSPLTD
jgi:hypothetical protein